MPTVIDDLLASLSSDAPVRTILVGVHWTAVCSHRCGLASTVTAQLPHGEGQVRDVGQLHTRSARELAELARSANPLEASIGVAALNSLLEIDERQAVELNALEVLTERGRGKNVALIGHFPFIPQLRRTAGRLWVIEQQPTDDEYPAAAAADLLPQSDVVAITGTTLINHTLDVLLGLCNPGALVMIVGASTPLSPVLFDHGATILSGARVINHDLALETISQGAAFPQIQGVRLLTLHSPTSGHKPGSF